MNAAKVSNCEEMSGRPEGCRENEQMFAATHIPPCQEPTSAKGDISEKLCYNK
jgi:hypothetical protein